LPYKHGSKLSLDHHTGIGRKPAVLNAPGYFRFAAETDIPGNLREVSNAATVAVHAQQYVLTLSAVSCRSRTFGERQVCLRIQLIDVTHALTN
jgi:hypothetical protein